MDIPCRESSMCKGPGSQREHDAFEERSNMTGAQHKMGGGVTWGQVIKVLWCHTLPVHLSICSAFYPPHQ